MDRPLPILWRLVAAECVQSAARRRAARAARLTTLRLREGDDQADRAREPSESQRVAEDSGGSIARPKMTSRLDILMAATLALATLIVVSPAFASAIEDTPNEPSAITCLD